MKCELTSCQVSVSQNSVCKCSKCEKNFCSQRCLHTHITQIHKFEEKKKSPFITEGEYYKKVPKLSPEFDISNFDVSKSNWSSHKIGQGAFGALILSRHKKTNVPYAIKIMNKEEAKNNGTSIEVIKREIAVHIRITHPNIVKLHSYSEDKDNFYMVMDYVPGGTLFHLIQEYKGVSENEAFKYFIQVSNAIYFLHKNGLAHRDIKPENILLDYDHNVKLCDFGWCVDVSKGERATFCGTFEYMSPEIINDKFYDYSTDIWSLGVLLYEMTHGYSPFIPQKISKNSRKEIFENINNLNYKIRKNLTDECIDLIHRLLTVKPEERIKIDEIFEHPWVKVREGMAKDITNSNSTDSQPSSVKTDVPKDFQKQIDEADHYTKKKVKISTVQKEEEKQSYPDRIENPKEKQNQKQKTNLKTNTMLNIKKEEKKKKYENDEDLSFNEVFKSNNKKDEEFDNILQSLEEKNKLKKKTKKREKSQAKAEPKKNQMAQAKKSVMSHNIKNPTFLMSDENNVSESEEFAFLNDLNQTRCSSKKGIDQTKFLNMGFLPRDLLYNEKNYKDSTQEILKTIDFVERAQKLQEERAKARIDRQKKVEEKEKHGFFDFFKCGACGTQS